MADKGGYLQIPSRAWWGFRGVLKRTPKAKIDDKHLSAELGVQLTAARQYLKEFQRAGLLTDDGQATPLAMKWRIDDNLDEANEEILSTAYPETLIHLAPAKDADRDKVVRWFVNEGLGEGSAKNKAATYLMIANDTPPDEDDLRSATPRAPRKKKDISDSRKKPPSTPKSPLEAQSDNSRQPQIDPFPLNVNVQIHISADASTEQIEAIFIAMRKHLHDARAS